MLAYEDLVSCCLALPPTIFALRCYRGSFSLFLHFCILSSFFFRLPSYYCFGRDVQLVVVVVVAEWWLLPYVREL